MSAEIKKYAYLDSVRGIAILLVLLVHTEALKIPALSPLVGKLQTRIGLLGVQLFYLASALTLFLSLRQRSKSDAAPRLDFFLRRFFRIAPLYWLAIAYYLWQDGFGGRHWLGSQPTVTLANILANVSFVHGFNPYWINSIVNGGWSIGIEVTFYLSVPFFYSFYSTRRDGLRALQFLFIGSLALAFAMRFVLMLHPLIRDADLWGDYLYFYLPAQFPVFVLGFITFHKITSNEAIADKGSMFGLIALVLADLVVRRLSDQYLVGLHVFASAGFAIGIVLLQRGRLGWLSNRFLAYVGRRSYSLYLTHFAVIYALNHWAAVAVIARITPSPFVQMTLGYLLLFGLALGLSIVTQWFVERPGIALGQRVISSIEKRRTVLNELPLSA